MEELLLIIENFLHDCVQLSKHSYTTLVCINTY
nr:MAG TPA: hypothetical protein [Caudoviricetes sp.]